MDNDTIGCIAKGYNDDIAGCLGFFELISAKSNRKLTKIDIMSLLKSAQTVDSQGKSYYEVIKQIFNKSPNSTLFKSGERYVVKSI